MLALNLSGNIMAVLVLLGIGLLGTLFVSRAVLILAAGTCDLGRAIGMLAAGGVFVLLGFFGLRGVRKQHVLHRRAILGDTAAASQVLAQARQRARNVLRFNGPMIVVLCLVILGVALLARDIKGWERILGATFAIIVGSLSLRASGTRLAIVMQIFRPLRGLCGLLGMGLPVPESQPVGRRRVATGEGRRRRPESVETVRQ